MFPKRSSEFAVFFILCPFCSHVFANPDIYTLVQYFQSVYRNEDIYELEGVHIANFEVDIFQAVLSIVVYQMLIVTNVPVNSAVL